MSVEHLIPNRSGCQPKEMSIARSRLALEIAAALVIVGLLAAIYGLRPNDNPPPDVARGNRALLERGGPVHRSGYNGPVKLIPGRVTTDALGMKASFEVSDHWYGEQEPGELLLGRRLTTGGYEADSGWGGIEVDALNSPFPRVARRLETLPGKLMHDVSPIRLGRHSGRRYTFYLNHPVHFDRWFRMTRAEYDITLLGVGHRTLVIWKNLNYPNAYEDQWRSEAEQVIESFRFHA